MMINTVELTSNLNSVFQHTVERTIERLKNGDYVPRKLGESLYVYFATTTMRIVINGTTAYVFTDYFSYDKYLESIGK